MEEIEKGLIVCGDIHGKLRELVWKLSQHGITNANVIVLGDFGVGFDNSMDFEYQRLEKKLIKNDLVIHALRGNHDDPAYFDGTHNYERLKFLKDNEVVNISGENILIIGGANSTDVAWRIEENKKLAKKNRKCWWENEGITKVPINTLPKRVDYIMSHEAPLTFLPIITKGNFSDEVYDKILDSRKYLDNVLMEVNAKKWFYGHYHAFKSGNYCGMDYRCLGELELFCLKYYII